MKNFSQCCVLVFGLAGYRYDFRIVASKVRTLDLRKNAFRKFKDKWGSHLQYKVELMEETL